MAIEYFADNLDSSSTYGVQNWPNAIYYSGSYYFLWQYKQDTTDPYECDPFITTYNPSATKWATPVWIGSNRLDDDSHGAPGMIIDDDGYIHVVFGTHGEATEPRYHVSTYPMNITKWTNMGNVLAGTEAHTYPKLLKISDGTLYHFFRGTNGDLHYQTATPNGTSTSWSATTEIINIQDASDRTYLGNVAYDSTNERIHLAWHWYDYDNDDYGASYDEMRRNIYHAYMDLGDGKVYQMDGTELTSSTIINQNTDFADCLVVNSADYKVGTYGPCIRLDSNGYPYLLFSLETTTDSAASMKHIHWTGSAWSSQYTICDAYQDSVDGYSDGDLIPTSNSSIIAYVTNATFQLCKYAFNGTVWSLSATLNTSSCRHPIVPEDYTSDLQLVFIDGTNGYFYAMDSSNAYVTNPQATGEDMMDDLVTALSKQIDDWFEGTADTNATNPTYTLVDTALIEKQSDWVSDGSSGDQPSYLYIKTDAGGASVAPEGEERVISSLTTATYTILVSSSYPFTAGIANGDTYEIHRKFSRAEKEQAIVHGCKAAIPHVYKEIQDRSIVFGDWLINGDFEKWSQTTYPDNWTLDTLTATQSSTYYVFGRSNESSCKFSSSGSAGSISQLLTGSANDNYDLWQMAGKTVNFYCWGRTAGTSELCLAVSDGVTTTYGNHTDHTSSSKVYHPGDGTWRLMKVTHTISDNPTGLGFYIYYDTASADAYVDKAHAIAGGKYEYAIDHLDLYKDRPMQVYRLIGADASDTTPEPNPLKVLIDDWSIQPNGRLHFDNDYIDGTRFEIVGMGHLTTPVSTYGGATAVTTEIDDINKEGQIIIAEAAKYLCGLRMNSSPDQDKSEWKKQYDNWAMECKTRRSKYAMKSISIQI